ncbi:MAG TPA: ISNCY family transposase [Candidatus Acidoferrales bacterium]|nr:ISNCY family transposase [Candidatus Acidoferrales bacterium]
MFAHLLDRTLSEAQAEAILRLSGRQVRRLAAAYRSGGPDALRHGNAGRVPANRTAADLRERVLALAATTYAGVNRAHLAELLAEREGCVLPERTLRRLLAEAGLPPAHVHRPPRHRSRRERMPRAGMLLQADGSRHRWFGAARPFATVVGAIDDATGTVTGATFREAEDAAGYFAVLTQTVEGYGLPWTLYSDRHGIFWKDLKRPPTLVEQLTGRRSLTQLGRALEEAGVGWLGTSSPQAKGRVERLWGTWQDRLLVELRLETITTLDEANAFLPRFLARHNARFAVPAADPEPAWRAWPEGLDAEAVFCFHYPRRVARDATVSWGEGALALPRRPDGRSWAGCAITLEERLDGSLWARHEGRHYPLTGAPADPALLRARHLSRRSEGRPDLLAPAPRPEPRAALAPRAPRRPAPDHPWRR